MFSSHSGRFRPALLVASFAALLAAAPAQAGIDDACFNFLAAQDYPRALAEAQALLKRKALAREEERFIQLCLGRALDATGRFRDALPAFELVEALSRSTKELATAYNWLGSTHQNLGDLDRAELYIQRALKASRSLDNKSNEATALNNLAMVVEARGDVERALALYREALALDPDEAKKPFKLNNIALTHHSRGEYAEAVRLLREALEIDRRQGDSHGAAIHQLNLGIVLKDQGDLPSAEHELTAGLKAIQMVGDRGWEAAACQYLAWLSKAKQDLPAARDWYRRAEKIYRDIGQMKKADDMRNEINNLN